MTKRLASVWSCLCALGFGLCASLALANPPPTRIVSLDLCSDWLLAHDAPDNLSVTLSPLVGRFPLPEGTVEWPIHNGSLEHVLSLRPDVVLVGEFNAFMLRQRLASLGVKVVVLPLAQSLDDLAGMEATMMALTGRTTSAWPLMPQTIPVQASGRRHGRLLLLGPNGYGTGRNTLEDSLITRAGWVNYIEHNGHVKLDLEAVAAHPPDAIVWSAPRHAALANEFAQHPVLQRAVPPERWIKTDDWRWQCPGPWMIRLIEQLQP
jgi:iron complex transport system substrate-binding protein